MLCKNINILPVSDIHLETYGYTLNISKENVDILILAGDIGNKFQSMKFIENILKKGIIVIYVLGNHEFYNINNQVKTLYEIKKGWKDREAKNENLYVLDNESVVINGIKFIGSTLWSKIKTDGFDNEKVNFISENHSDLKYIYKDKTLNSGYRIKSAKNITISDYNNLHEECIEYISEEVNKPFDGVVFLIVHYPILKESSGKFYDSKSLEAQFYFNAYEELVISSHLDYIIHGHIHESFNYMKGKIKNICNPLGYKKYNEENLEYDENLILKINTEK